MRPAYLEHDAQYRRRREEGRAGWERGDSTRQTLDSMERVLARTGKSGGRMVELGCGAGDLALHFAGRGWDVLGIDIAPFAIAWAREKAAGLGIAVEFSEGDVTRDMEVTGGLADVVLDGHCLHCIIGEDRKAFLDNARKYLKADGVFIVHTMCGEPRNVEGRRHFDATSRCLVYGELATRYFGRAEEIVEEVRAAGFEIVWWGVTAARSEADEDCLAVIARARDEAGK